MADGWRRLRRHEDVLQLAPMRKAARAHPVPWPPGAHLKGAPTHGGGVHPAACRKLADLGPGPFVADGGRNLKREADTAFRRGGGRSGGGMAGSPTLPQILGAAADVLDDLRIQLTLQERQDDMAPLVAGN